MAKKIFKYMPNGMKLLMLNNSDYTGTIFANSMAIYTKSILLEI